MHYERAEQIEGTLSTTTGDVLPVALIATVVELRGQAGIEDEMVSRVRLASRVPDGSYVLDYFYLKPFRGSVRVKYGTLVAAI
jgi:hypothetical protein